MPPCCINLLRRHLLGNLVPVAPGLAVGAANDKSACRDAHQLDDGLLGTEMEGEEKPGQGQDER